MRVTTVRLGDFADNLGGLYKAFQAPEDDLLWLVLQDERESDKCWLVLGDIGTHLTLLQLAVLHEESANWEVDAFRARFAELKAKAEEFRLAYLDRVFCGGTCRKRSGEVSNWETLAFKIKTPDEWRQLIQVWLCQGIGPFNGDYNIPDTGTFEAP